MSTQAAVLSQTRLKTDRVGGAPNTVAWQLRNRRGGGNTDALFFERGSLFYGSSFRRELQAPVDLLVYTPAELEELQVRRQFFADIVAQGLWIDASRPA